MVLELLLQQVHQQYLLLVLHLKGLLDMVWHHLLVVMVDLHLVQIITVLLVDMVVQLLLVAQVQCLVDLEVIMVAQWVMVDLVEEVDFKVITVYIVILAAHFVRFIKSPF